MITLGTVFAFFGVVAVSLAAAIVFLAQVDKIIVNSVK